MKSIITGNKSHLHTKMYVFRVLLWILRYSQRKGQLCAINWFTAIIQQHVTSLNIMVKLGINLEFCSKWRKISFRWILWDFTFRRWEKIAIESQNLIAYASVLTWIIIGEQLNTIWCNRYILLILDSCHEAACVAPLHESELKYVSVT